VWCEVEWGGVVKVCSDLLALISLSHLDEVHDEDNPLSLFSCLRLRDCARSLGGGGDARCAHACVPATPPLGSSSYTRVCTLMHFLSEQHTLVGRMGPNTWSGMACMHSMRLPCPQARPSPVTQVKQHPRSQSSEGGACCRAAGNPPAF
jgi:hypothetical protein